MWSDTSRLPMKEALEQYFSSPLLLGGVFVCLLGMGCLAAWALYLRRKVFRYGNELRKSINEFQAFFENTAVGIAIVNTDGRFVEVNTKFLEMLDYDRQALVARRLDEISEKSESKKATNALDALWHGRINTYRHTRRMLRRNGTCFWGDLSLNVVKDSNGRVYAMTCILIDLDEGSSKQISMSSE